MTAPIFISHSSKDKDTAQQLAHDLAAEGFEVWLDRLRIDPSDDWVDELEAGVNDCSVMIVVWTSNASTAKWVRREVDYALDDERNKPVIPLRYDDTPLGILLNRVQAIDFRQGYRRPFDELVAQLNILFQEEAVLSARTEAWSNEFRSSRRSSFLEEHNYRYPDSPAFGSNTYTKQLSRSGKKVDSHYVTFVSVPIPLPLKVDLLTVPNLIKSILPPTGAAAQDPQWEYFPIGANRRRRSDQENYVLYDERGGQKPDGLLMTREFLRVHREGALEYATTLASSVGSVRDQPPETEFDLVPILGIAWKMLSLSTRYFAALNYLGEMQFCVNLIGTSEAWLVGFAHGETREYWPDPKNRHDARSEYHEKHFVARNANQQYVYNLSVQRACSDPSGFQRLIDDLSHRLQMAFDLGVGDVHYRPDTKEFPWGQCNARAHYSY